MKGSFLNSVNQSLGRCGLHLMRSYKVLQSNLNLLEICVPALLYHNKFIHFVQIGASDGKTNDPIFPLVNKYKHKMTGICLEPLPNTFEKLKETYMDFPKIYLENSAVVDKDKDVFMYVPINGKRFVYDSQKASLNKNLVLEHGFNKAQVEKVLVKGISFSSLIKKI